MRRAFSLCSALIWLVGCGDPRARSRAAVGPSASAKVEASSRELYRPPPVYAGNVVARAPEDDALYIADEDHAALRVVPLPADVATARAVALPGRPAQVLPTSTHVLVTIRDPGLLLAFSREDGGLVEVARVALPADAWGVAISPDQRRAVVTSAWTHRVSIVDLAAWKVTASLDVAREPRGVVVDLAGDVAWVSHLMGPTLTRISGLGGDAPVVDRVKLPAAPLRAPFGVPLDASLGYALALSPDGSRLFAPRHALGAIGMRSWFGAPTVDVLDVASARPIVPPKRGGVHASAPMTEFVKLMHDRNGAVPYVDTSALVQPRAVAVRASTRTLLVLSEGSDTMVELDGESPDPASRIVAVRALGRGLDQGHAVNARCAAPSGVALSADDAVAYVFCRASYDLAIVGLAKADYSSMRLADDPLGKKGERGRRMFYGIGDRATSGGLACSGCHPDGRDDGHTWHEVESPETKLPIFVAEQHALGLSVEKPSGFPRQTQMLAGRLDAPGPYGWHAQAPTLQARMQEGFQLHRWDEFWEDDLDTPTSRMRAQALAPFLREGLVAPPREARALTDEEERGRQLFVGASTGCADCHLPGKSYTDRVAHPLRPLPTRATFADEEDVAFKTPDLSFVGGTPPYYHDGSVQTLEALIELNHDRMGRTSHLGKRDRAALVAFLKTL